MFTEQITERLGIAAPIYPVILNSTNSNAGPIDMSKFKRAFFLLEIGTVTGSGKITAVLQQGANSNLTGAANLSNTNASMANLNTSNRAYTFEVRNDQMTAQYLSLNVAETAGANVTVSVSCWGDEALQKPGSKQNVNTVVTQNVVV